MRRPRPPPAVSGRAAVRAAPVRLYTDPVAEDSQTGIGGSPECALCPVCVVLQAVTTAHPQVTGHLLAAGRELTLAVKAVLDEHAHAHEGARNGLRRINID